MFVQISKYSFFVFFFLFFNHFTSNKAIIPLRSGVVGTERKVGIDVAFIFLEIVRGREAKNRREFEAQEVREKELL